VPVGAEDEPRGAGPSDYQQLECYWFAKHGGEETMDLKNLAVRFVGDEQGQDLIEYALLATFVSLLAIVGAGLLGTALNNWYGKVATNVNTAAGKV
jgi:Flp pilus assembly pilin Flp